MVALVLRIKFEEITFAKTVETAAIVEQVRKDVRAIVGEDVFVNAIAAGRSRAHNSPFWSAYQEPLSSRLHASSASQGQLPQQSCQGCDG